MWMQRALTVETRGQGFTDITARVADVVQEAKLTTGLCHVFLQHTSASLLIQENAAVAVRSDLQAFLSDLADGREYEHDDEGPDDMPAHVKNALLRTSETIPIAQGGLALGTWQGLYLVEHRTAPHTRRIVVTLQGE